MNASLAPEVSDALPAATPIEASAIPVPASPTDWTVPATFPLLSVIAIQALLCAPCATGVNVTSSVQEEPAAIVAGAIGQGCDASAEYR